MSDFTPEHIAATGRELMRIGSAMMLNPDNTGADGLNLAYEELVALVAIGHRRLIQRPAIITDWRIHHDQHQAMDMQGNISATVTGHQSIQITIKKF